MTKNFDNFIKLVLEFTSFLDLPESPPYGFWISPDGHFFPVNFQKHDRVGMDIINKNQTLAKEYDSEEDKNDVYSFLQKRKWLRVAKSSTNIREYYVDCFVYDADALKILPFEPTRKSFNTLYDICQYYSYKFKLLKE